MRSKHDHLQYLVAGPLFCLILGFAAPTAASGQPAGAEHAGAGYESPEDATSEHASSEHASRGHPAGRLAFDIPAQPLAGALRAFGRITQMQILYDSRLRADRRSAALQGVFTPEDALQTLLTGTGLMANYTAAKDVVLTLVGQPAARQDAMPGEAMLSLQTLHVQAPPQAPAREDLQAERWYATAVQAEILHALQQDPDIRGGNYRVLARIWIDPGGVIHRLALARSTGDAVRDAAIAHVLTGLALSEPPPGLRQPLGIVLVSYL
jgi:hypothetical protein